MGTRAAVLMGRPGRAWSALAVACLLVGSAGGRAAEQEAWDALVEEAHKLLTDPGLRAQFQVRHRTEALDATCAILRYPRGPEESLREARALSEPFFASLALGGMAALTLKSDPEKSEKLLEETQQLALKINHWTDSDATSLGYLIQLVRHHEPGRARRLLASFRKAVDSWGGEYPKSQPMLQLALATIEVDPGAAKELLLDRALKSGHNSRSIEALVQFLMKQSPDDTLKLAQERYDAKTNWPTCAKFLRSVLAEHALRDPKDAFERARNMRPADRDITCYSIAMALLAADKKEQAKPAADFLESLEKSGELKSWYAQDRLKQVREAMQKGVEDKPGPRAATPEEIQAFLDRPDVQGFARIVEKREIRFRDGQQAAGFLLVASPLAGQLVDQGYPHHGSPRSVAFGVLGLLSAIQQGPTQAMTWMRKIEIPELRAFYSMAAYQVARPLPPAIQEWPLRFWPPTLIQIPDAKDPGGLR